MLQLLRLRKDKNKTQQAVADELHISRQLYGFYESGKREPNLEMLIKLAVYFDVSTDELLNYSPKKKITPVVIHAPDEKELIELYRELNTIKKNSLLDYVRFLATQQDENLPQLKSS